MEDFKLPPHIHKISDKWYQNTTNDKYIHSDHIEAVCETYWLSMARKYQAVDAKIKYKKSYKQAKRRWGLD